MWTFFYETLNIDGELHGDFFGEKLRQLFWILMNLKWVVIELN